MRAMSYRIVSADDAPCAALDPLEEIRGPAPARRPAERFAKIPYALTTDRRVSDGARTLYALLLDREFAGHRGICAPANEVLMERLGISLRQVMRRFRELEAAGWLASEFAAGRRVSVRVLAAAACVKNEVHAMVKNDHQMVIDDPLMVIDDHRNVPPHPYSLSSNTRLNTDERSSLSPHAEIERERDDPPPLISDGGKEGEKSSLSPGAEAVRERAATLLPRFADRAVRTVVMGECSSAEMIEALERAADHGANSWSYVARCLETVRARPAPAPGRSPRADRWEAFRELARKERSDGTTDQGLA